MNLRKVFLVFALALSAVLPVSLSAQQMQPLPIDTAVRHGKLPNGLTYIVRHNANPQKRANYYIAQTVGSILEEDNQAGLAHFLEHMAFNGTKNFPGKNLISFLERIGCRFGADLNAYTAFDETVYTIMDAPTQDINVVDSCLLIMHDWSNNITLDGKEIDEERGVIHEEWRTRDNGDMRAMTYTLEKAFPNNKYGKRMPIGTMEVVDNFPHEDLRAYYKKWYRPDQQCVIVVGDIDPDYVVKKLTEIFADIKAPENAAERYYVEVEDNEEPISIIATDPEVTSTRVQIMYKRDIMPREMKATVAGFMLNYLNRIASSIINERFMEMMMKPNAPFLQAGAYQGPYMTIAKTKDALNFIAIARENEVKKSLDALVAEIMRIKKFGFTAAEYDRARTNLIKSFENSYNERGKRTNGSYTEEYKSFFIDGGYIPGIETEYEMIKMMAPQLPLELVNNAIKEYISVDKNVVLTVTGPKKDGITYPTEAELTEMYKQATKQDVEAPKEEVSDTNLMERAPKGGKIASVKKNQMYGATEVKLKNGVTVYLKTTDYKDDEVQLYAVKKGGSSLYGEKDALNVKVVNDVLDLGGLGKFDAIALQKALTGRSVDVSASVDLHEDKISGSSTVKDFETMMQLVYLTFTDMREDQDAYEAHKQRQVERIKSVKTNPLYSLRDTIAYVFYNNNPIIKPLNEEDYEKIDYKRVMQIARERYANANGMQFFFVGNIDEATMIPLIEKYIGALPSNKKQTPKTNEDKKLTLRKGKMDLFYKKDMDTPMAQIYDMIHAQMPYNLKNVLVMDALVAVLDQCYTASIREAEGGAYSVGVTGEVQFDPMNEAYILVNFPTDPARADEMNKLVYVELDNIANNGPKKEYLDKTLVNMRKSYEENLRKNAYWLYNLKRYYTRGADWAGIYLDTLNSITTTDLQNFVKEFMKQDNRLQVRLSSTKTEAEKAANQPAK
ncbi:protease3 [Porphyromonas crevioricanis]|uniref:Protease3 n=1 Tax=Porphyromonas crevioricanis TaxID=393921 RepID=A0A2X4PGA2_9PORP|nr:M16 family metallopeptidase [Porphyromonas crevioricanis]GAD06949.1 probable zinc protease pqqL [Porphyromonas crevioricanis JCM 13913]SQH72884.1 protease3 [Porphyromonas crevioricanis]